MAASRRLVRLLLALVVLVSTLACGWAAAAELNSRREWDERHSVDNLKSILRSGSLRPVFLLYPGLAYLPQTAALAAARLAIDLAGGEPFPVVVANGDASPVVYRVGRWICVLYGAAALLLTYAVGRRLFSAETGLLATFLMAASPWFVRGTTVFKPDPLLMLLTLAVFLWSLDAAERGGLGRYLIVGAGIGLAGATKHTGVLAALPLVVATLLEPGRRWRWVGLGAAALVSAAVFLALNPFPDLLPEYFDIGGRYARWAELQEPAPHLFIFLPGLFLSASWHGALVGGAALAGLALAPLELQRRRKAGGAVAGMALFLGFVLGFPLVCAAVSSYPKANIFLPLLPFTSLAAAWVLVELWRRAAARWPVADRGWVVAAATGALAIVIVPPPARYVYQRAVPETTLERAAELIGRRAPGLAHRSVVYESGAGELRIDLRWTRQSGVAAWTVGQPVLADLPEPGVDLTDYEVFAEERLHGERSGEYLRRLALAPPGGVWIVEPVFARRRGERLVVVAHPWRALPPALPIDWRRIGGKRAPRLRASLPEVLQTGETISIDLALTDRQARACRLLLGDGGLELRLYSWEESGKRWMTRRFPLRTRRAPLRFECADAAALRPRPAVDVWRWAPAAQD